VRGQSVSGRVMTVHQGMRITRAWKFSRQDWLDLAIYTAELVLPIFESRFPDDERPRTAIKSGSAADAAGAAGSAADAGARSAAHAARAAVAAADAMTAPRMPPRTLLWPLGQQTVPHTESPLPRVLTFMIILRCGFKRVLSGWIPSGDGKASRAGSWLLSPPPVTRFPIRSSDRRTTRSGRLSRSAPATRSACRSAAQGAPAPHRPVTSCSRRQRVLIVPAGKCVAPCRRPVLGWPRRGKVHPLHQEGGARDVR
jgi:hypothetical protein